MEYVDRRKTPQGEHIILIGFFRSSSNYFLQRYEHVELQFSDGYVTSITRDPGYVHYCKEKGLSRYTCFFEIAIHPKYEEKMQLQAQNTHEPFSTIAMYWNFLFSCYPIDGLFCSNYITTLLQVDHELAIDLNAKITTPDVLFEYLKHEKRAICSYNKIKYL